MEGLVDGVPLLPSRARDLFDLEPLEEAQARDLTVSLGELRERPLEVVARLDVVEWRFAVVGESSSSSTRITRPRCVEPLRRPLDHLVDDDAEGDGVAPAALELGEEPDDDRLRALEGVVLAAAAERGSAG